jgi:hypothetical protein
MNRIKSGKIVTLVVNLYNREVRKEREENLKLKGVNPV